MKLWAISDLHLANAANRQALEKMPAHSDDGLILAGDVGETEAHLHFALRILVPRFGKIFWVPGNHDLWTLHQDPSPLRGEAKYRRLVEICRSYGVLTPEDPYAAWPSDDDGPDYRIVPLFLLYDYSYRPDDVADDDAVEWAAEAGIMCSDEVLLHPDPYPTRPAWCAARVIESKRRLDEAAQADVRLILINHWPPRHDLVYVPRIPEFSIWCGTKASDEWHRRYPVRAVIYGHIHIKGTHFRDGVRFEEVSFGYPRDWDSRRGIETYLRQILPAPSTVLEKL